MRLRGSVPVLIACVGLVVGCGSTATPPADLPPSPAAAASGAAETGLRTSGGDGLTLPNAAEGSLGSPSSVPYGVSAPASGDAVAVAPDAAHPSVADRRRARRNAVVRVGYALPADDTAGFVMATGFDADTGDLEASARAVVADANRRGGVGGSSLALVARQVPMGEAVRDPSGAARRTCEFFAHDQPVDVLLSSVSAINTPSLFGCLAREDIPLLLLDPNPHSLREEFDRFAGSVYHHATVATERLAPVWTDRLARQGWFGGWNTDTGGAVAQPAAHGILHQSGNATFAQSLRQSLRRHGQAVAEVIEYADFYEGAGQMSSFVYQMKAKGVTHVFVDKPLTLALFTRAANSQAYYPRYGITTNHGPSAFLTDNVDPRQLRGAAGVGFFPLADIPDPYRFPRFRDIRPARLCDALHDAAAVQAQSQLELLYQHLHCDAVRLLVEAYVAGAGTTASHLRRGFAQQPSPRAAAGPEQTLFGYGRYDGASSVRDLAYDSGQQRFVYGEVRTTVR